MCENRPPKNWRRIGLTALMIVVAAIVAVLWIRATSLDRRFDAKLWSEDAFSIEGSGIRRHMVNDLQQNVLERGMTRTAIESLLGKQDPGFFSESHDLAYWLGRDSDTGAVTRHGGVVRSSGREKWLTLKFNDHDQLVEWHVLMR